MSNEKWKAYSVFVNNKPNEWHVGTGKWGDPSIAVVNNKKNAKLIAAAPESLAALEAIVFQVVQGKVLERDACITQARTAIAKAKGE